LHFALSLIAGGIAWSGVGAADGNDGGRGSGGTVYPPASQGSAKRFVKKQQIRWTPRGAHLLLRVRVHVLNDELGTALQRWYPKFGGDQRSQVAA